MPHLGKCLQQGTDSLKYPNISYFLTALLKFLFLLLNLMTQKQQPLLQVSYLSVTGTVSLIKPSCKAVSELANNVLFFFSICQFFNITFLF